MKLAGGILLALLWGPAIAASPAAAVCEIDGRAVQLSDPASTAGKSGVLRCKDPHTGRLLRESTYDSGQELGLTRSFHPDGKPRRVAWRAEPGGERAVAEFNTRGQLTFLRCADKPLLDPAVDDQRLCGFEKLPSTVALYDDKGVLRSRLVFLNGRRLKAESLYDNGQVASVEELSGNQRVERQFSSAGIKRRESVALLLDRNRSVRQRTLEYSERGWLVREQRWDTNGELVREDSYYTNNGQPKTKFSYSGAGPARVVDVVEYFENGQRSAEGRFLAPAGAPLLAVGTHKRFNDRGLLVSESVYDDKGRVQQERSWNDAGELVKRDAPAPAASGAVEAVSRPPSQ
ncbi:toxin-antitoxin system YwqK family antitoxin [Variovorax sp. OV329]|uniref:toxin-antitoxin system YwqK family antitoxin n=1 Tax=Variovorax sp. OV329 TaxID=1882825 RepID=UPI0008EE26D8|nr:hypothetical protein [Variovorax sp. OV329]SFM98949.1 Antitoxin component YwqK of the YwqJK toxin-antitoxin module [Variovorax sp. OV329]